LSTILGLKFSVETFQLKHEMNKMETRQFCRFDKFWLTAGLVLNRSDMRESSKDWVGDVPGGGGDEAGVLAADALDLQTGFHTFHKLLESTSVMPYQI
jgi:hypothetical protein